MPATAIIDPFRANTSQTFTDEVRPMKPKTMILMVVAVGCGLGASYMTSKLLAERNRQPQTEPTVPVVVAKVRVPAWQQIKEPEKYFEVKPFPQSVAPKNALGDIAAVKDQKLNKPVDEGKPVSMEDLVDKDQRGIEDRLQPGQRAIAIKVNPESLAGGLILPGARVDILCTTRGNDASTSMILQNMLVLAVDAISERNAESKAMLGQTVTLAATPEEAAKLTLGQSTGELRLMLKSDKDSKTTNHVVARRGDLQKGHTPDPRHSEPEPVRSATNPAVPLPALPPDAVARSEEPKPKPEKPHILTIRTGTSTERHVFRKGEDDESTSSSPPPSKKPEPKGPAGKAWEGGGKPTKSPFLPPMPGQ